MTNERYPFQKSWRWRFVKVLDFLFDPLRKSNSSVPFPESVKNILVIRLDHMGDLICSLPVFEVLKKRYPQAKITALTGKEGESILAGNPFVDELIIFNSNWFNRGKTLSASELFRIISRLKQTKFDLGFDLRGDVRNILLMVFTGVRYRVGYGIAGGAGLLHSVGEYDETLHQAELNLKLVTGRVPDRQNLKPQLYLSEDEKREAKEILRRAGVEHPNRLVAVHPEAGYVSKEWDEKNLVQLIELLIRDKYTKVLILGLSRAKKITGHFSNSQVIDLVGTLTLRQMISVIGVCQAFVGNDSGPSHIAQALGIPALVIASGTNEYHKWGIWRQPSKVLSHSVSCAPCHLTECTVAGHPCMSEISSQQAFQAMEELLA